MVLARTDKSTVPFAHSVAVVRIVSGSFRAWWNSSNHPETRRHWRMAPSDVLSEVPPSGPSSHVAMLDIMSPLVAWSCSAGHSMHGIKPHLLG